MKKIFTLFLAMGVAATAMAGGRQSLSDLTLKVPFKKIQSAELAFKAPKALNAPAFTNIEQFEGTASWSFLDLYGEGEYLDSEPAEFFIIDEETGEVGFELLPQSLGFELVKAYVDLENGTMSIPNIQLLGADEISDVYFYLKEVDLTTGYFIDGASEKTQTIGNIIDNTVVFPETDIWVTGDPAHEDLGCFTATAYNGFTFDIKEQEEDDPDWENYAMGQFVDGWAIPAMQTAYDQYQFPWEVTIQRYKPDHNTIRLVHPYNVAACPFYGQHQGKGGYIVMDITDHDYVLVCPGYYSGFNPDGTIEANFFNIEGFYASMGITKDQVLSTLEDFVPSTFDGTTIELRNLFFNMPGALDQAYNWNGKADRMHGRLTITKYIDAAIESVETEVAETAETIYDLSGRRLTKVTTPGLYIVNGQKVIK